MQTKDYAHILNSLPKTNCYGERVTVVGASKTVSPEEIKKATDGGLEIIGENRVDEFLQKQHLLPPCKKHLIGHLQTNKIKYILGKFDLIHSVDSLKLANALNQSCKNAGYKQDVLVEINIGMEEQKYGFMPECALKAIENIAQLENLVVKGIMAVLPHSEDRQYLRDLCLQMRKIYDIIKKQYESVEYLSLGMSGDYPIAVECGSNMIRIGSALFGERIYKK